MSAPADERPRMRRHIARHLYREGLLNPLDREGVYRLDMRHEATLGSGRQEYGDDRKKFPEEKFPTVSLVQIWSSTPEQVRDALGEIKVPEGFDPRVILARHFATLEVGTAVSREQKALMEDDSFVAQLLDTSHLVLRSGDRHWVQSPHFATVMSRPGMEFWKGLEEVAKLELAKMSGTKQWYWLALQYIRRYRDLQRMGVQIGATWIIGPPHREWWGQSIHAVAPPFDSDIGMEAAAIVKAVFIDYAPWYAVQAYTDLVNLKPDAVDTYYTVTEVRTYYDSTNNLAGVYGDLLLKMRPLMTTWVAGAPHAEIDYSTFIAGAPRPEFYDAVHDIETKDVSIFELGGTTAGASTGMALLDLVRSYAIRPLRLNDLMKRLSTFPTTSIYN